MLIQFNFKNYKSFKDETILDLSAAKITEFSERVTTVGKEKILPVAAIYGTNASGKSNVYRAFEYMSRYVANSLNYGGEADQFAEKRPTPFLFSKEAEEADTQFEVYFTIPGDQRNYIYNYGFCIGREGVTEEWLNSKAKTAKDFRTVFYRDSEDMDLSGLPKSDQKIISVALEKQALIVSVGAKLKVEKCKLVRDWFLRNAFTNFADPVESLFMHRRLPKGFVEDPKVQEDVIKYFSSFDESIQNFRIEKVTAGSSENEDIYYKISAIHKKIDSPEFAEIPLQDESAGTLKMFALYPELQKILNNGGVLFIDELNARLHPLLTRNFVLSFLNPEINIHHAQLIFTAHDTWLLSTPMLRRDEIWFVDKDDQGISSLYSLVDFVDEEGDKIRKDESFEKNYLIGKYGAIPSLKSINFQKENSDGEK